VHNTWLKELGGFRVIVLIRGFDTRLPLPSRAYFWICATLDTINYLSISSYKKLGLKLKTHYLLKEIFDQLKSDRQLRDKMLTAKSPSTITTLLLKVD